MPRYCNTTTDLFRVFPRIEELKEWKTIKPASWSVHSGSIYKTSGVGYGEMLFENGAQMTAAANLGAVSAGKFFYDSNVDILYAQATTGTLTDKSYKWGVDWETLKEWAVDQASQMIDATLDPKFPIPLPEWPGGSSTQRYDGPITMASAYIAASMIAGRADPPEYTAQQFANDRGTPENLSAKLLEAGRKIVDQYNTGVIAFSWQVTRDEVGGVNLTPAAANTSVGMIQLRGRYLGLDEALYKLKCTTGGDVGTAKFKLSLDNGANYEDTEYTTDYAWQALISSGLDVRFFGRGGGSSAFIANDTWQLELTPSDRNVSTPSAIGNIRTRA